ncbi:DUF4347 domain-containing protein, partial [Rhizobiaceae sp. 2RAB30]
MMSVPFGNVSTCVLQAGPPALEQIAELAERHRPLGALHVVVHGRPGALAFSSGAGDGAPH